MRSTIFRKIFAGYFLIICLFALFMLVFSLNVVKDFYQDMVANDLRKVAGLMGPVASPFMLKGRYEELDRVIKDAGARIHTRITVIAANGAVLADSDENPRNMENHGRRPEVITALEGSEGKSVRFSSTANREMLYVALPLERNGQTIGAVRASLFLKDVDTLLGGLNRHVTKIALIMVLLTLVGAFLISRGIAKPIKELTGAAEKVAAGDLSVRVLLKNKDEMKKLADSFNRMNETIQTTFVELRGQKEELNGIMQSLREGLLVLDRGGRIVHANESFRQMTGGDPVEGRFFWEALRNPEFVEVISGSLENREGRSEEVVVGSKTFLCNVAFVRPREELVAILHDITDRKNVERVKKDFVINVSHELRTPLTAIKGFAETLLDLVEEPNRKYVEIIEGNADRLTKIVDDLLLLSNLEEKGEIDLELVDFGKLVHQIVTIFDQSLREKGLSLALSIQEDLPSIKVDAFKIEQLLINLLDNAIKYTEHGEIRLSAEMEDKALLIRVKDTGIGIPKGDIPRLFERFYVVDKSRSRKSGGTGLGLSIVKHIVMLHHGMIDVESSLGQGTTITVRLPLDGPH
jgi:two-component system, OmpR family, phosphate regulon sensor histidine kinase PhoR